MSDWNPQLYLKFKKERAKNECQVAKFEVCGAGGDMSQLGTFDLGLQMRRFSGFQTTKGFLFYNI